MALLIVTVLPLADVLPTVCAQIPEALPERDLPTQSIIDDRGALIAPLKTDLKDLATGQPPSNECCRGEARRSGGKKRPTHAKQHVNACHCKGKAQHCSQQIND
ncbi:MULTISPECIES: hypothetical protein [Pseudomonas syringae group]|uniref:Uncharacterized protein n=1 Tax=Pseudomonas syringae pv. castaneae TaxID=264450 RepID=A0A0P9RZY4_PSESX|nr:MULTISPECIES: hypothetical protein [Pseudomonas syringae group]KPW90487.1 hypothetical protein ALO79_100955 [Pseudomonas syringae pv. castaneae]